MCTGYIYNVCCGPKSKLLDSRKAVSDSNVIMGTGFCHMQPNLQSKTNFILVFNFLDLYGLNLLI